MKYIIDTEVCKEMNISLETALYLLSLYLNTPITQKAVKEAWHKGFICAHKSDDVGNITEVSLEKSGFDFIDSILGESINTKEQDRYEVLAEKLIELYPKGKKEGTAYMWRDSKNIIAKRLKALVNRYNVSFTDEQAVNATKRYVESFNGNYTYMQLLKYFISKRTPVDGSIEETSQLLSYIENESQEDSNKDWTTKLI